MQPQREGSTIIDTDNVGQSGTVSAPTVISPVTQIVHFPFVLFFTCKLPAEILTQRS